MGLFGQVLLVETTADHPRFLKGTPDIKSLHLFRVIKGFGHLVRFCLKLLKIENVIFCNPFPCM